MGANYSNLSMDLQNSVLNQKMTDIMTSNANDSSNIIQLANNITIENHGDLECNGNLTINQTNVAKARIINQVTNQVTDQLRSMLNNDIQSSGSQTDKLLQGFLAGIGQVNKKNLETSIRNQITNIVNTTITTENINHMLSYLQAKNNYSIVNYKTMKAQDCTFIQNNAVDYAATTIINNLSSAIVNDSIINRSVIEASQVQTTEQKGLDDLLKAAILPLLLILLIVGAGGGKILNPKFILAIGGLIIAYILIAYFAKIWPFKDPKQTQFWMCGKNPDGFNTGYCVSVPQSQVPQGAETFATQDLCNKAVASGARCQQYWKCDRGNDGFYTGTSSQCHALSDGNYMCPYHNQTQAMVDCTNFIYRCDKGSDSSGKQTAVCDRVNPDSVSSDDEIYKGSTAALALTNCQQKCGKNDS